MTEIIDFKNKTCSSIMKENGIAVFVFHNYKPEQGSEIEKWVRLIAKESQEQLDWYVENLRAVIITNGDVKKVHKAIAENRRGIEDLCDRETRTISLTPPSFG